MSENKEVIDLDNLDDTTLQEMEEVFDENLDVLDDEPAETEEPDEPETLHKYKEVVRPKMYERKEFILVDLMSNNCTRCADLMMKLNKNTDAVINLNFDEISDEDYHKLLKTADNVNRMLMEIGSLI